MDTRKLKDKAQEAFSKGKFAKAGEAYEKFCEAEPSDLHARLRMGDAWSKAGQKDKAIGAYSWAAEGFAKEGFLPRAIAASKLILELDPAHKGVQKMLADLYARKNTPAKKAPTGSYAVASGPARALSLEPEPAAKSAAPASTLAAKAPEVPSPMNRADAIELPPEDDVVPVKKETAVDQKQRRGFEVREDAIELPEEEPVDAGVSAKSAEAGLEGIELDVGPSSGTEIEIAIEPTPSAPPPPAPPPVEAPILLDTPKKAAPPPPLPPPPAPPPAVGPKGGVYELDVGDDDESLDAYSAKLAATPSAPPPAPREVKVPDPMPSAPLELSIEVVAPEPAAPPPRAVAVVPAPVEPPPRVADSFFDPEAVDAPAPQADLPPPSLAIPSIAPMAPPPAPSAVAAEPPRPSPSSPPGLKPRRAEPEAPAAASEASPDARIWLPPGFAPPAVAPMVSAAAPKPAAPSTEARSASTDLEKSLEAFSRFDDDAPAVPVAPRATAAPPAMAGFTELDLDGDSLLHAVESAATQGAASRGEEAPAEEALDANDAEATPGAMPKIPLFSDLPEDAFIALFESCPLKRHEPGELVLAQGSQGEAFYVICAGSVRVFRTDAGRRRDLATLEEGAFFGEMALLSDRPRSASVEAASEDTQLLEISAAVLANLSKQHPHVATALKKFCRQRMLSNLMSHAPLFAPFSKSDRKDLVQKFRTRETKKGDVVIKEGQRSDGMYVVLSGEVEVTVGSARAAMLKEGDVFGEMSLLTKAPAGASVTSTRHTSLLRLPREDFDMLILSHPQILVLVSELTDERNRANAKLAAPISGAATMV